MKIVKPRIPIRKMPILLEKRDIKNNKTILYSTNNTDTNQNPLRKFNKQDIILNMVNTR